MRELEYPFDAPYIMSKKKKIKKLLLGRGGAFMDKRVAILGGSTTDGIRIALELFLLNHGIRPAFYESGYNQYYEDAMFPNAELEAFAPDVIYIHTTNRNVTTYPAVTDTGDEVEGLLRAQLRKFTDVWDRLAEAYRCPIIQNNFEMPLYRLLGNRDASDVHGAVNFLTRLNMGFYEYAQLHANFHICDINYISADYGLREWSEPFYWYMYKYALNVSAIPYLSFNVANIIKSIFGRNKKGIVLDLDNTLWGGVVGDDGVGGIALGPEEPEGRAYLEFQKYVRKHRQLGVVLCVNSKNDYGNAIAGMKHPDSVLTEDDFISIKANWEPKDRNLAETAEELGLLPESLVFVDDSPAERHLVTGQLPGVCAPELGEAHGYIRALDRCGFFEVTSLSRDDARRNEMYRENKERRRLQSSFADYGEYLLSLGMRGEIRPFEPVCMARVTQLANKSNQFNLTTRRYSQAEIEDLAASKDHITLYGRLADRFGDNGVVSAVVGHVIGCSCHIELWVMSCRVLKRGMESAMMDALMRRCMERGIKEVRGYYLPTAKNGMVRDFYASQGFQKAAGDEDGGTEWAYGIGDGYQDRNRYIKVEG